MVIDLNAYTAFDVDQYAQMKLTPSVLMRLPFKEIQGKVMKFIIKFSYHKYMVLINSMRPSDSYMRQWIMSTLVQKMPGRLVGAKPLSEPMQEYC